MFDSQEVLMIKICASLLVPVIVLAMIAQAAIAWTPNPSIKITAHGAPVYEGSQIKMNFSMQHSQPAHGAAWRTCYRYETKDGTAKKSEGDYRGKSGVVCWNRGAAKSGTLTIQTVKDYLGCECDETVNIVVSEPETFTRNGTTPACGEQKPWPCTFTATAKIKSQLRCKIRPICN